MCDAEYFDLLQDRFYDERLDQYILDNQIDEVIFCGCYQNTFYDSVLTQQHSIKLNQSDLVKNVDDWIYIIDSIDPYRLVEDVEDVDGELVSPVKIISAVNTFGKEIEVDCDFNFLRFPTDGESRDFPYYIVVESNNIVKTKINYDSFIDNLYIVDDENKDKSQQGIPATFRLSFKPFYVDASDSVVDDYETFIVEEYNNHNGYGVNFSNLLRYSFGNIVHYPYLNGEATKSYIDSGVFTMMADYICQKQYITKKSVDWSEFFNYEISSEYILDMYNEGIVSNYQSSGIEMLVPSGLDERLIYITNTTPHKYTTLQTATYYVFYKQILKSLRTAYYDVRGTNAYNVGTLQAVFTEQIQSDIGGIVSSLDVTITDTYQDLIYLQIDVEFVNTQTTISVPVIIV